MPQVFKEDISSFTKSIISVFGYEWRVVTQAASSLVKFEIYERANVVRLSCQSQRWVIGILLLLVCVERSCIGVAFKVLSEELVEEILS